MSCCRSSRLPSPYQQQFSTICRNCRRDNTLLVQEAAAPEAAKVRKTGVIVVSVTCPCGAVAQVRVQVRRS